MATVANEIRPFTRGEFERLAEGGFFDPEEKLELIEGVIYEMTPQTSRHATAVRLSQRSLEGIFLDGYDIRCQMPLALGDDSEPEPDIAVVFGSAVDYTHFHPPSAVLVVEVADSSLPHDRERKARLYALNGIADYWLLNLREDVLEVYRDPRDAIYRSRTLLRAGDRVSPLAHPEASIEVSDLIPGR